MPGERVPEHDLVRDAGMVELAPDHGGASFANGLLMRLRAREHERLVGDEVALLRELDLGAEGDPREARAPMARGLAQQQDARRVLACLQILRHVLAALARRVAPRRRIPIVVVPPWIEDSLARGRAAMQEVYESCDA